MKQARTWITFVRNPRNVLAIAQTGRYFGERPSTLLHIEPDSQAALDLDIACGLALLQHDNKRDYKRLESLIKSLAVLVVSMFGGDASRINDDDDDED